MDGKIFIMDGPPENMMFSDGEYVCESMKPKLVTAQNYVTIT